MSANRPVFSIAPAQPPGARRTITAPFDHYRSVFFGCLAVVIVVVVAGGAAANSPSWTQFELTIDQSASASNLAGFDWIALGVSWVLSPVPGLILAVLASLTVWWRSRDWITAVTFAVAVGGSWVSAELVKIIVSRARPDGALLAHPLQAESGFDSFPSGHTCLATALVLATILMFRVHPVRAWLWCIGIVTVLLVAWSRVAIGAHYPLDVLAAIVYTAAAMLAFLALWNRWVVPALESWRTRRANAERVQGGVRREH
jgi:membrane-associated phospholipid phosphatase